jgi:topoisomerase-4 subunit A
MLDDIDKDTVDFAPNYDGSEQEPAVLPARCPTCWSTAAAGIAVGMATNIPPHNAGESCARRAAASHQARPNARDDDARRADARARISRPAASSSMTGRRSLQAYETGRGAFRVRATLAARKSWPRGTWQIVVTEIPYQVQKCRADRADRRAARTPRSCRCSPTSATNPAEDVRHRARAQKPRRSMPSVLMEHAVPQHRARDALPAQHERADASGTPAGA